MKDQLLIKAMGQAGGKDHFETVVIGEDFVTTSRSTKGYFVFYHYQRTDPLALAFQAKKSKENAVFKKKMKPAAKVKKKLKKIWKWKGTKSLFGKS